MALILRSLVCILALLAGPLHSAEPTARGGSFSLAPGVLIPAGRLASHYYPAPQAALDFDVGINPRWSIIFGAGYSDHTNVDNPDARLVMAPAWLGFKSKAQLGDAVELYWDLSGELFYEKQYMINTGIGSIENLDGAAAASAGMDLLLTKWLLIGCETRYHLIMEPGEVFPFVQLALRLGLRG